MIYIKIVCIIKIEEGVIETRNMDVIIKIDRKRRVEGIMWH